MLVWQVKLAKPVPMHDIYDIRVNWLPSGIVYNVLFFGVFIVTIATLLRRTLRLPAGTPLRRRQLITLGFLLAIMLISPTIMVVLTVQNLNLGQALRDNKVPIFTGKVQDRHFGNYTSGRNRQSDTLYFQVDLQWFRAPFRRPYECLPHIGDTVTVAAKPVADIPFGGALAYRVLRLQNTRPCNAAVWGD